MNAQALQTKPSPEAVWSSGDYVSVADRMISHLGSRLVDLAGVSSGDAVLDVAAGAGNASLPAAATGAGVTALDITQTLLDVGERRAAAAGLDIAWVHGSAEELPFADASFDRVLSCVGVPFTQDHRAAAAELARVCRPGGRIALIAWTSEGFLGQVLAAVGAATGAAASGAPSALAWGTEEGIEALLGDGVRSLEVSREHVDMPAASAADWVDFMAEAYGPLVRARAALEPQGTWAALHARLVEIADANATGGDAFAARAEYLVALAQR